MGFRFRKTIKILPGVRVNLSKSGVTTSLGVPGATINVASRACSVGPLARHRAGHRAGGGRVRDRRAGDAVTIAPAQPAEFR
jgi:glyoxylate carboligase